MTKLYVLEDKLYSFFIFESGGLMEMNRIPPFILLLIATILWGGNFVIGRAIIDDLPPFTLAFLRWCVAFIVFLPIAWTTFKRDWPKLRRHFPIVVFMAFTGVASFNTLVYIGVHYTTAINASLMNTSTPIIIYLISFIILRERLTRNQMIGTAISFIGVLFIISNGSLENLLQLSFNRGDLIVIVAIICWSIYSFMVKQYAEKLPVNSTFLATILIGAFMLAPFSIYEFTNPAIQITWSPASFSAIFFTGVFASIVAFLCWNTGVVRLGANRAGIFLNFIPVFATLFAVLFISESLQLVQVLGGLFVIFGVFLSMRN